MTQDGILFFNTGMMSDEQCVDDDAKLNGFMFKRPDGVFECLLCKTAYSEATSLHAHFREDHVGSRWFPCPRCDVTMSVLGDFADHVMTHTKVMHACGLCNAVLKTQQELEVHKMVNHITVDRQ